MPKDLDTNAKTDNDNIASDIEAMLNLSATLCNTPYSNLHLLVSEEAPIRKIFAAQSIYIEESTPFCKYLYQNNLPFLLIPDASKDERFNHLESVKNKEYCFYAGVKLKSPAKKDVGILYVTDVKPKKLIKRQQKGLKLLGKHLYSRLQGHKNTIELRELKNELQNRNEHLRNFAGIISHDMKMPLANTILTCDLMRSKYRDKLDEEGFDYLHRMKQSSLMLSEYITNILQHYQSDQIAAMESEEFYLHDLLEDTIDLLNIQEVCDINLPENNYQIIGNKTALGQIFINLLTNSLKYNDKGKIVIDIDCDKDKNYFHFSFRDNGIGISEEQLPCIFNLFKTFGQIDRNGNIGNGIGLSTVRKLIMSLGGDIKVESELGRNTVFYFNIKYA